MTKSRRLCLKHLRRLLFIHLKDAGMGNRQRASAILQPSEPIQQQNTGILPLPIHYIQQSLPVEGGSQREPLANDLLMYWTAPNWCAHGLAQTKSITNPMYKSFAELFQKRPSPLVPPRPLVSPSQVCQSTSGITSGRSSSCQGLRKILCRCLSAEA